MKVLFILLILIGYLSGEEVPLRVAIKGEPTSLDPNRKRVIWDQFVANRMFDTLTKCSENFKTLPVLLHSWSNPSPNTWSFTLKKGVKFHNGDTLTTKDVIFTLDRIKHRYKSYADIFSKIKSYRAIDKYSFIVKTYDSFDSFKMLNNIYIVPSDYIQKVGEDEFALHPIGTGAYMYIQGNTKELRLKRYENYWGKKANIENVIIKHIPRDQQHKALIDNDVDIVQNLNYEEFEKIRKNQDFRSFIKNSTLYHYLGMDVKRVKTPSIELPNNPFRDSNIRLAISKAIDLEAINRIVFKGKASIISQLSNSSVYGYNPDIQPEQYNIKKAKRLMLEAGYESGFEVTLHTPLGVREKVADIISKQLKQINITVTVVAIKDKEFWREIFKENHKYSFFLAGFGIGTTVERSLSVLFGTRDTQGHGRLNFTGYSSAEFDAQLKKGAKSTDRKSLLQSLQQASEILMKDKPIVPIYNLPKFYAYSKSVDLNPSFRSELNIRNIKFHKSRSVFNRIMNSL